MQASDFDFELPDDAIARHPTARRDGSRLLVVDRSKRSVNHHQFSELPQLLTPGDLLVANDTRVLEGRLHTKKVGTGGKVELLLIEPVREEDPMVWSAMAAGAKSLRVGMALEVDSSVGPLVVTATPGMGFVHLRLPVPATELADRFGELPLPPYLKRKAAASDADRYQTVFSDLQARRSVAAPTAGLHFTPELLQEAEDRGIEHAYVTLHVGPGTFLPVRTDNLDDHVMHAERYTLGESAARRIRTARDEGRRVISVGTTVTRVLETCGPELQPTQASTDIFIHPGYEYKVVGGLLTNFHLPRSTLVMLVSAFADRELILGAYREAVEAGYRFYSYGDAMLVL